VLFSVNLLTAFHWITYYVLLKLLYPSPMVQQFAQQKVDSLRK